jgi:hypothetical protein
LIDPSDLDILPVGVVFDNYVHFLHIWQEMSRATQEIVEMREWSIEMPNEHKRLRTLENYQPWDYLRSLFEAKASKE